MIAEPEPSVGHPETVISICSGVGGLDLGLRIAVPSLRVVTYVEREGSAVAQLAAASEGGALDAAPIWTDLRTFDGRPYRGRVRGVIGGYPCQGESVAGKQRGVDDPRWLWPSVARIISEVRPAWCFFENVANHASKGFRIVGPDLEELGYRVEAGIFSAEEVGATHKRERIFILAVAADDAVGGAGASVGDTDLTRLEGWSGAEFGGGNERAVRQTGAAGDAFVDDAPRHGCDGPERKGGSRGRVREAGDSDDAPVVYAESIAERESQHESGAVPREYARTNVVGRRDHDYPFLFPPGPDDYHGWESVLLAGRMDLLPALPEPVLRQLVDGLAGRLDQLRAAGNGVVALQAAFAAEHLAQKLGWRWQEAAVV